MKKISEKINVGNRELSIEHGELAKQAGGAVKVTYGETVILASCCLAEARENTDFFPLTVDYRERTYAAGKIPGGYFKREGRPQEKEIITSRLIDRPIRPLFPEGYFDEVQIVVAVLSSDGENDSDIPSMIGSSCALALTGAPFLGPVGAVRIGRINGSFIINPTFKELEESDFNLVIAGTESALTMMEGECGEASENDILEAIDFARPVIKDITLFQKKIISMAGTQKREFKVDTVETDKKLADEIRQYASPMITAVYREALSKQDRSQKLENIKSEVIEKFNLADAEDDTGEKQAAQVLSELKKELLRELLKKDGLRVDGRKADQIRQITCKAGYLPRTHGSGIFTKGETQSLAVVTLGTSSDQQIMDELEGEYKKRFMLHYNFPPYSVGEVRPMRGPGRREIGHGLLAEKALMPVLRDKTEFPYTIRLVSDILESNGSSSMATVCAGSIALMDAGVPIKAPVAGVGMGIIDDIILSDMLGDEDHYGDMDFKVAGTREGITAIQMDIKIEGITKEVLGRALEQAKKARLETLDNIEKEISKPRESLSPYAPHLEILTINPDKIGILIGPGGKNVKKIQEETGANIDIEDDGTVTISSASSENLATAVKMVKSYTEDVEPGKMYEGKVTKIMDFGAFVEVLPGKSGMVHISELAPYRVGKVTDILNIDDVVKVKCIEIDDRGRINLSRVKALSEDEKKAEMKKDKQKKGKE
ncbi:MAG: polyribonucleotide nucleotidyltransferase [Elusimicrobia bacterium]|nr:polyribonucleotide nucleotidyltransferase [Elusimicrobiota bacterium]